jgi:putative membrane protein
LFGSAVWLWLTVRSAPIPVAILILLFTMMQMGLPGALLTFAPAPLYGPHVLTTEAWSLSTVADQQLAGSIMWSEGSFIYLALALGIVWTLLTKSEHAH